MKVMISQPMAGLTEEEVESTRNKAMKLIQSEGNQVINSIFNNKAISISCAPQSEIINTPIYFLSKSIEVMSLCDAIYFCKGWENNRGCQIEHKIAQKYGMEIMYED